MFILQGLWQQLHGFPASSPQYDQVGLRAQSAHDPGFLWAAAVHRRRVLGTQLSGRGYRPGFVLCCELVSGPVQRVSGARVLVSMCSLRYCSKLRTVLYLSYTVLFIQEDYDYFAGLFILGFYGRCTFLPHGSGCLFLNPLLYGTIPRTMLLSRHCFIIFEGGALRGVELLVSVFRGHLFKHICSLS